ncbi:endoglucanase II [Rhizodiscina lignyota]|uniref:Endoglucanase EG-II n=1 Tax=Rhizodiscina lignyota TaxID=1504668 RepID=A0A9P4M190_9PEZI|nr:endoglucanase II [Rhizodiscina lignyota]
MFFTKIAALAALTSTVAAAPLQQEWYQCGGINWTGSTECASGLSCQKQNDYYFQCLPATTTVASAAAAPSSSSVASPSGTTSAPSSSSTASSGSAGKVKYGGVNIAGFDFGCDTSGNCNTQNTLNPLTGATPPADDQMNHFANDDGLNAFRLPVGMQFLFNNDIDGDLDATNFAAYDKLVAACTSVADACVIDFHNYARWNGEIFGQGGPTNDQFAAAWSKVATKYADNSKVVFGIMNEPHDLDVPTWAGTVQAAVTAIRKAGATSQMILLPGDGYTSAATFVSNGNAAALSNITNLDGSTDNLVFDVHKYLDSDNSGTSTECVTNNIDDAFSPLADWLRENKRMAFNTETGGGNTDSCVTDLSQQLAFVNKNSDVYVGYLTWAAGGFDQTYALVDTPIVSGSTLTDNEIVAKVLVPAFSGSA